MKKMVGRLALVALALSCSLSLFAQERPKRKTPAQSAQETVVELKDLLKLDSKQEDEVYKLYLKQAENEEEERASSGFPGGGFPGGGMPGGGMPGGGMPGGGMPGGGSFGGGMPGGGMPSGGDFTPPSPEKIRENQIKAMTSRHKKLSKKLGKVLSADQLQAWEEWDNQKIEERKNAPLPDMSQGRPQRNQ